MRSFQKWKYVFYRLQRKLRSLILSPFGLSLRRQTQLLWSKEKWLLIYTDSKKRISMGWTLRFLSENALGNGSSISYWRIVKGWISWVETWRWLYCEIILIRRNDLFVPLRINRYRSKGIKTLVKPRKWSQISL